MSSRSPSLEGKIDHRDSPWRSVPDSPEFRKSTVTHQETKMKRSVMDDVNEVIRSVPTQFDELLSNILSSCQFDEALSKLCEKCSIVDDLISNAEQEAITIVTEAAQRTESMKAEFEKEAEKRVEALKKELADLAEEKKQRTETIKIELAIMEVDKERRIEAMCTELEEERKRITSTRTFEPMVTLNVGGQLFMTATATLKRFPSTMFGAMFSGRHALTPDQNGAYCIDRDGRHFHEILNFLRGTTASTPKLIERRLSPAALEELKVEADFYGIKDLMFPQAAVRITGATGLKADSINGIYAVTDELSGDMPVYAKMGSSDLWLMYVASTKDWNIQRTAVKGSDITATAYCKVSHKCLPHECPAGMWKVHNGDKPVIQTAITISSVI